MLSILKDYALLSRIIKLVISFLFDLGLVFSGVIMSSSFGIGVSIRPSKLSLRRYNSTSASESLTLMNIQGYCLNLYGSVLFMFTGLLNEIGSLFVVSRVLEVFVNVIHPSLF